MSAMKPPTQVKTKTSFFLSAALKMGWGELEDQVVMDVGCGVGDSSIIFATIFPKVKRIIAVDILGQRVEEAKKKNPHPKIEYEKGDIQNVFTMARWTGEMDKIVSIFCFNCVVNQRAGYTILLSLLKPNGEAAIMQCLCSSYYSFLKELAETPKWMAYTEMRELGLCIPISHFEKFTAGRYLKMLQEIGFEVMECVEEKRNYTYNSDAECKEDVFNSCPMKSIIPAELVEEFKTYAFEVFSKHNKRTENGLLTLTYSTLTLLLRKPEIPSLKESDEEKTLHN